MSLRWHLPWTHMAYSPAQLYQQNDIIKEIRMGLDCTIKAPFELTLVIPPGKKALKSYQRTEFYDLRSLDGAQVGLKYYPNNWSPDGFNTRIAVRIHDPQKNEKLYGVNAEVMVQGDPIKYRIDDYGEKGYRKENFNFAVKLAEPGEFLVNETYLAEGVTVKGYVFVWDGRLLEREIWRFDAGVLGHQSKWNVPENPAWRHDIEFETKNGMIGANLRVLAANCKVFREIKDSGVEYPAPIDVRKFHKDVVKIGLKLCYDARLVHSFPFDQKLELLLFFNRFKVSNYKEQLEEHLLEHLDRVTVGRIFRASIHAESDILKKKAWELIKDCIFTSKYFIGQDFDLVQEAIAEAAKRERWGKNWEMPLFQQHHIPNNED